MSQNLNRFEYISITPGQIIVLRQWRGVPCGISATVKSEHPIWDVWLAALYVTSEASYYEGGSLGPIYHSNAGLHHLMLAEMGALGVT